MDMHPQPGSRADLTNARKFLRLRVKDRILDIVPDLPMTEKFAVREATGMPFEAFVSDSEQKWGEDSLFILWWVGRRQNGEPNLRLSQAEGEWPTIESEDDLEISEIDLDDGPIEDVTNPQS
jgi:hypothetical protein